MNKNLNLLMALKECIGVYLHWNYWKAGGNGYLQYSCYLGADIKSWAYSALYHKRTFISPINLLYYQMIYTNKFVILNKIFCAEFMVIQNDWGPTHLRGFPGALHPSKRFCSFLAYSKNSGNVNFFQRRVYEAPLETPTLNCPGLQNFLNE